MLQKNTWTYWFLRKQIAFLIFYGIEMYYIFKVSASVTKEVRYFFKETIFPFILKYHCQ